MFLMLWLMAMLGTGKTDLSPQQLFYITDHSKVVFLLWFYWFHALLSVFVLFVSFIVYSHIKAQSLVNE